MTPSRHRHHRHRRPRADGGFVLLESIVSIALITIIMTALTALFVTSMKVTNHQRSNQAVTRIATSLMDQARAAGAQDCTGTTVAPVCPGLQAVAAQPGQNAGGIAYTPTFSLSWCTLTAGTPVCGAAGPQPFVKVSLTLSWTDNTCPSGGCAYPTSLMLSAAPDPYFESS